MEVKVFMKQRQSNGECDRFEDIYEIKENGSYTVLVSRKRERNVFINTDSIESIYTYED